MHIVLIHGFNVKDGGAKTVDKLAPYLEAAGHTVDRDDADYGFFSLRMVRFRKHPAVVRIAKALKKADVVIEHSNGVNFGRKARAVIGDKTPRFLVFRLSGAVNRSSGVDDSVKKCWVFHTRTDFWVWLSAILLFHPWGRQGQRGYSGDDDRIVNRDYTDIIKGHSDWFDDECVEFIASEILRFIDAHND